MKHSGSLFLAIPLVLAIAVRAPASPGTIEDLLRDDAIVFNQQPTRYGGPLADTLALDEFGFEVWQQLADNVRLNQAATIRRVNWWAFYGGEDQSHQPPPGDESIRIRFYNSRITDGLPGDILLDESFVNSPRTFTGHIISDGGLPKEYLCQADLTTPISLAANTVYWIEILQVGDADSTYRWETGYGRLAYSAFMNDYTPDWRSVSGSYAFQLSTTPEPATLALLVCVTLIRRRGQPTRRCRGPVQLMILSPKSWKTIAKGHHIR